MRIMFHIKWLTESTDLQTSQNCHLQHVAWSESYFLFILKVKPWGRWDKCLKPSRDHSLCLQELILIPGTCSYEWANMSLGQRLRTYSVCAGFFFLCFSLFHFLSIFSGFHLSSFLVPWIKILYFNCKINGREFSQKVLSSHFPSMERVSEREKETEIDREKMLQHFKQVSATSDQTSFPNQQKYHSSNGSVLFKPIFPSIIRISCHQTVISQKAGKEWSL